jgi:hypothetical protein
MAEVLQLLQESWTHVAAGAVPPTPLVKALISKVLLCGAHAAVMRTVAAHVL